MLTNFYKDFLYAFRTLARTPIFTVTAISALALGIGLNTGIFSILNGLMFRELPVPNPSELVSIGQDFSDGPRRFVHGARRMFSMPEYRRYRDENQTLSGLMGYTMDWRASLNGDDTRDIHGKLVTCNYFDVLQQHMAIGAGFTSANCEAQTSEPIVVLSHGLWKNGFGSDPGLVNKSIALNGQSFAVVGVAPEGFHGTEIQNSEFFAPVWTVHVLRPTQDYYADPNVSWLMLMGRRKDAVGIEQVRADLGRTAAGIDEEQAGRHTDIQLEQATAFYMPGARTRLFLASGLLLSAFGLVLLIACANVANLFLARGAARSKEIAVRLSLGATRKRLIQQLLTECLVIAFAGGALGSVLALWSFKALLVSVLAWMPIGDAPIVIDPTPDLRVLMFGLCVTLVTAIAFGLIPAIHACKTDPYTGLKKEGRGRSGRWLQQGFLGAQVALCTVLVVSTGLLVRGLYVTQTVQPGFEYRKVAVAAFEFRAPRENLQQVDAFQRQIIDEVGLLPGIDQVARSVAIPLSVGRVQSGFRIPGQDAWYEMNFNAVSPEYFSLLRIPIVRGRNFASSDLNEASRGAIVTEATGRRYWPGQDPVGQTILLGGPGSETRIQVIGVAKDAQLTRIGEIDNSYFYLPAETSRTDLRLLVRSDADFASLATDIRNIARRMDSGMVVKVSRLEDSLAVWRTLSSSVTALSGSLGLLALVLALVGVYGVGSYVVSRRVREFGIRMVLGASGNDVHRLILWQMMRPVIIAAAIGVAGAIGASNALRSVLFGVSPLDPLALITAVAAVLSVTGAAILVPVRRATRTDPIASLRHECP